MKKLFKIIAIVIICIIIVLLCLYFLVTSSFFLKKAVLPMIASSIGAKISTETIVFSPFESAVEFTKLNINSKDNYSIKIGSFQTKFRLFELFNNKIIVDKFNLKDSYIEIVQKEEIKNESTPIDEIQKPDNNENIKVDNQSAPLYLDLNNIVIDNLNFTYEVTRSNIDKTSLTEFKNFNLSIPRIKSGEKSNTKFECQFNIFDGKYEDKLSGSLAADIETVLKNNSYPSNLDLTSKLTVEDNITPITVHFESLTGENTNIHPFKLNGEFTKLPLLPLFKTFIGGSYSKTDGMVDSFEIKINGSNLTNFDINSNIEGTIKSQIKNLTLPTEVQQYGIAKIIFLPFEILSHLSSYTGENIISRNMTLISDSAQQITQGMKDMLFKTGDINISLNRGVVNIKQLEFKGDDYNAVRSLSIKGKIDLNSTMKLSTSTSLAGIIIPIRILGTLDNPKPNFVTTLPGMIIGTTSNILSTGFEAAKSIGTSLISSKKEDINKKE